MKHSRHPDRAAPRNRPRPLLASLATLFLCLAGLVVPARTATLDASRIKETVFPNGLRLVVKEAHATELASVQVWVRAGGFLEDAQTAGTAHVIEHLLFKGTESRGPGSIDEEIENLGGLLQASTQKDWTNFTCTVSGKHVAKVLTVVADALRNPRFRQEDFEAEKPILLDEIAQIQLTPEPAVSRILYDLAFKRHPYRHDVRGTAAFVNRLDLNDVRAYYKKHYIPANMTVVVVGDVNPAGVERVTRTAFAADAPAAGGAPPAQKLPEPETACAKPERRVVSVPFSAGYVGMAYPAPSVKDDPDVYAMDVLLTLLEHGGAGRLPRLLKSMAAVQATYETRRQPGLFTVLAAVPGWDSEKIESLIRKELEFLRTQPIPESELSYAKRALRGSYALDNETYAGQAATLGYYASIDRWQFATDYLARVEQVTAAQVQAVATKYLDPERTVTVLFKPGPRQPGPGPAAPPPTRTTATP